MVVIFFDECLDSLRRAILIRVDSLDINIGRAIHLLVIVESRHFVCASGEGLDSRIKTENRLEYKRVSTVVVCAQPDERTRAYLCQTPAVPNSHSLLLTS
jgi:hypothetical protein